MLDYLKSRREDVIAGLVTIGVGIFILTEAFDYRLGTLTRMGPGYFPMLLGVIMCLLGCILVLFSEPDAPQGATADRTVKRGVILVTVAFLAFALLIERVGMVPSVTVAVFLSALSNRSTSWLTAAILAVGTAAACWLIFSLLLGLQMKAFW
ncbi:membrane protein [Pseudooceanicola nanhaiensis]|jgi:hypothetical protein|uniref:Membrane protein n=1 Tax=Pseudooceanicola nanhaiensis TaxID=375761 RepID=A0A917T7W5_9RHOB|nr:tripartite tricarboxylate transporter TctB family protein [Pseudooceanicola nanhaiensis]GGM12545.1 membrane protein [Pseudooceanicola nanhaiensis]